MIIEQGHQGRGTKYHKADVHAYATNRHGPDGAKFLDPFFTQHLRDLSEQNVIDIGAGAGPWAILAAQNGARRVIAVDYQFHMAEQARKAVSKANVSNNILVVQGDGAELPSTDKQFSLALSINVGCNLPQTETHHSDTSRQIGFQPHFNELARVLEVGGKAVVTAPTGFGEVFTDGEQPKEEVMSHIESAMTDIGDNQDARTITNHLNKLTEVYRATFARRTNGLVIVTDESILRSGEPIWRRLPGLTVPNFYHSEREYCTAATQAGLTLVEEYHEMFATKQERITHNASTGLNNKLGPEYVKESGGQPPFAVFVFKKTH